MDGRKWIPERAVWSILYTYSTVEELLKEFGNSGRITVDGKLYEECEQFVPTSCRFQILLMISAVGVPS